MNFSDQMTKDFRWPGFYLSPNPEGEVQKFFWFRGLDFFPEITHKGLRELRSIMESMKLSNHELFTTLDANEDGFATIDEFCVELEKIIPLPRPITEGFFAYIDKQKIGVIDLESFLKVMKKSIYVKERKEVEDNFDWPINPLKREYMKIDISEISIFLGKK